MRSKGASSKVRLMLRAWVKLQKDVRESVCRELDALFPDALEITVYDCFRGYSGDQDAKVVLGVEVRSRESYHTHVVKLGTREAVEADYKGWQECFQGRPFSSRIFVPVAMLEPTRNKPKSKDDRVAIVYQNAYQLYGEDTTAQPQFLETVVSWSIHDDKPDPVSVERVIRQIYSDLQRWFYHSPEPHPDDAIAFYRRRLKKALANWTAQPWRAELRRDLIWLFCGRDAVDVDDDPMKGVVYLDPCDYVVWALDQKRIPETLVGKSHGDLHARNILVGIQRGEAEYPAVYDYGEMGTRNVLAWDFVKLEMELKVRMLLPLYRDENARNTLMSLRERADRWHGLVDEDELSARTTRSSRRADQMAFAFEFESHLDELTDHLYETMDAESLEPPGGRRITGNPKLDRALAILLRIRQEAAFTLGECQPQRESRDDWKEEYYFAMAAYAVSTGKWDYKRSATGFALVAGGVAAARMTTAADAVRELVDAKTAPKPPFPSFRVPLVYAHKLWKDAKPQDAVQLLDGAVPLFGHAVPLLQEYGLALAGVGKPDKVLDLLKPFEELCDVFRDYETLSRIGRTCKDLGDRALKEMPVSFDELPKHAAWQFYQAAYKRYRQAAKLAAPEEEYYPAINAATMAMFLGKDSEAQQLAGEVVALCAMQDLGASSADGRFWILVTEGEASLLRKNPDAAANYYHHALANLPSDKIGMAQSSYNQLCRLWWALGPDLVRPVYDKFKEFEDRIDKKLQPGPLGDCKTL